ncbi:MAG: hypothetical protein S4CHLAM45_07230 [Chlamydiales bacterium]|nr:hypothetical protein [Chlamydiales bacterium]MCH9620260.1 hypothetical protein [Chlamydiales bacterium]MCH9622830.1 hypothetical protein [Chlamydiales bacterium]
MKKRYTSRTGVTTKHLCQLLPSFLNRVGKLHEKRPDLVVDAWPSVIGPKLASFTRALSFTEGVLFVAVNNSTLYSLLSQNDKPRIIKNLRDKFPQTTIKTVVFRLE